MAILLVLLWHYVIGGVHVVFGTWPAYALLPLRLTWSGVDLFFVLSGFLIGGILYDEKTSDSYFRTFYLRRIHRIFPLYFIWIALFFVGLYFIGPQSASPLREVFNRKLPSWSFFLFLQNFFMSSRNDFGPLWVGSTWSLAVEEQFYLLLPFMIRRLSSRGITILAVASILAAPLVRICLVWSGNVYMGPYTLLPCRADALGFGVLIAMVCRNRELWELLAASRRQLYAALLILGGGLVYLLKYQQHLYTIGLTWIAAFYAILLLLTLVDPGWLGARYFHAKSLTKLGTVAYAVYIFHQGMRAFLQYLFFGSGSSDSNWTSLAVTLLSLMVVMLLAALSWRIMEKPLIRHAHAAYRY